MKTLLISTLLIASGCTSERLVVFGDSFVHTLMPFLTQNFEEVHRYSAEEVNGAVAARHQPAAVVFQMVERHGERLLRPPLRLQALCDK